MKLIRDHEFKDVLFHDRQLLSDFVLENCTFEGGAGLRPDPFKNDPNVRPKICNVTLQNTNAYSASLEGAIVEDVLVDSTKAGKAPIFLRANAYRHVTLRGRIGHLEIRGKAHPSINFPEDERKRIESLWDAANAEFYKTVDWALDITEASFGSFCISGIPTKLIRRNPENTAVVTRHRALTRDWKNLPYSHGVFRTGISWFLEEGYEDKLLIACSRGSRYRDDLEDLKLLREAGVAE
ncbi:MAG: hypothetical protein J5I65_16325 [Aridibacter famidurans]|nr:hypothetical protein [Aridibacter famidurans]